MRGAREHQRQPVHRDQQRRRSRRTGSTGTAGRAMRAHQEHGQAAEERRRDAPAERVAQAVAEQVRRPADQPLPERRMDDEHVAAVVLVAEPQDLLRLDRVVRLVEDLACWDSPVAQNRVNAGEDQQRARRSPSRSTAADRATGSVRRDGTARPVHFGGWSNASGNGNPVREGRRHAPDATCATACARPEYGPSHGGGSCCAGRRAAGAARRCVGPAARGAGRRRRSSLPKTPAGCTGCAPTSASRRRVGSFRSSRRTSPRGCRCCSRRCSAGRGRARGDRRRDAVDL